MIFVFDRIENIFPQCFQKVFYSGLVKVGIVW